MSSPITSFVYPKLCNNLQGQAPPIITSNWSLFEFPKESQLRKRIMFQAFTASQQSMPSIADPFLLQVRASKLAVAPQGYTVSAIHFCSGVPVGIFAQQFGTKESVYIGLADTGYNTPLDQLTTLFDSNSFGVYGFGALSVDSKFAALSSNTFKHEAIGLHTLVQGPFNAAPQQRKVSVQINGQSHSFNIPAFPSQQPLIDQSELVGVCFAANQVVYIYGYQFDMRALARSFQIDKLNIIQKTHDILITAEESTQAIYKQLFLDLMFAVIQSPTASSVLSVDKQEIGIQNAEQFLNGRRVFIQQVQSSADTDATLGQLCSASNMANRKLCACFNMKEPHPCLNYNCVQEGYKPITIADKISPSKCEDALKGMTINYQNCQVYSQQVAGGYISTNNNIEQQCIQQVGTDAMTINIQNKSSTPSSAPSSLPSKSLVPVALISQLSNIPAELYIYGGAFLLFIIIVAIIIIVIKIKQKQAAASAAQQIPYDPYNGANYHGVKNQH